MPPITKSLEYHVMLKGNKVIKEPNPGFEYKVESDYNRLQRLGSLVPKTVYDRKNNRLIQEAVRGRFATKEEVEMVRQMVLAKGYEPRGITPRDVIVEPDGALVLVDVGNFTRL